MFPSSFYSPSNINSSMPVKVLQLFFNIPRLSKTKFSLKLFPD
jgi:hypothetical protein